MLQLIGWMVVAVGGAIVCAIPLLFLLVARSRFLPRNLDRRREALGPLWRLVPVWLYLTYAVVSTGHDLLSDTPEPRWLITIGIFLSGMMVWSSVEGLRSALQRSSQERRDKEAFRRDTRAEP